MVNYFERYTNLSPDKQALFAIRLDKEVRKASFTSSRVEKRLIAYVVSGKEKTFQISSLRSFLKEKLPDYMIPSDFMEIGEVPLAPNGKIDRKALPLPEGVRPELEEAFVAPRSPIEEDLVKIWADVLHLDRVGIHDNFFDLGGHSLVATKVMSRVQKVFNLKLPLRTLFEAPTVAGFSLAIVQRQAAQTGDQDIIGLLEELESLSEGEIGSALSLPA
jgi:acyl carrier protein